MSYSFAQSYLIDLLENNPGIEEDYRCEAKYGVRLALSEFERRGGGLPLEVLADALAKNETDEALAVVNLMNRPLGSLWVRAALLEASRKLSGLEGARVVIVGLWGILKGRNRRRTQRVEERFMEWKAFVESQLTGLHVGALTIIWVG